MTMLFFPKFLKGFSRLKLQFSKNFQLRNRICNFYPLSYGLNSIQFNLCSTIANKNKQFSVDEIRNLDLSSLNIDKDKVYEIIYEILGAKAKGWMLPQYMKLQDIIDLVECQSQSQRKKSLKYLYKKEKIKLNNKSEKKLKRELEQENKNTINANPDHIQYGMGKNTLLLKAFRRNVMKFYEKRLAKSVLFGQKIVIDLSYDQYMWKRERKNCASQLRLLFSLNRYNPDPYDLYFCNADPESRCVQYLNDEMPNVNQSLVTLYEQSYLDLFPAEDLVYLSPHASETLKTYDHKAIYIIGGFVDTVKKDHISVNKAKEEGIKSYSLPLDDYVLWGCGSRSLSIDQVFSIMQTMRDTGDWKEAFKYVPTRKLKRVQEDSAESEFISDKLFVMSN